MRTLGVPRLDKLFKLLKRNESKLQMPTGRMHHFVQQGSQDKPEFINQKVYIKHHNSDTEDNIETEILCGTRTVLPDITYLHCYGPDWTCNCSLAGDDQFCPCNGKDWREWGFK